MGFVPYEHKRPVGSESAGPALTINAERHLGYLSRAAWRALGKPERVRLYYNPARKAIGIMAARGNDGDAVSVSTSCQLSLRGFLRTWGLVPQSERIPLALECGMLTGHVGHLEEARVG